MSGHITAQNGAGGGCRCNEQMRSVDELGNELYTLPPTRFTAARDAAVAQARADGDPGGARELAALKRPTQGAFLVNLLALRRPEVVTDLIDLGERIRAAQGTVSAADLRELTTQRRTALRTARALCRTLAGEVEAGTPTEAQLDEASATLEAAMADPAAAEQVRTGRVVKALHYAGFGGAFGTTVSATAARRTVSGPPRPQPGAVRPAAPDESAAPVGEPATKEERAAQAEFERRRREQERAAWERLARAEAGLAAAQAQERAANEEMDRIADEITRLRGALETASQRARTARTARQTAERELTTARRAVAPDA
jgi:hypothetical protein